MTRLLSLFGLMRVSEHEAVKLQAAADRQALQRMTRSRDDWRQTGIEYAKEIASLRPDALLWRNARDKRAKRKGVANG